jgi:hypothetical protein
MISREESTQVDQVKSFSLKVCYKLVLTKVDAGVQSRHDPYLTSVVIDDEPTATKDSRTSVDLTICRRNRVSYVAIASRGIG